MNSCRMLSSDWRYHARLHFTVPTLGIPKSSLEGCIIVLHHTCATGAYYNHFASKLVNNFDVVNLDASVKIAKRKCVYIFIWTMCYYITMDTTCLFEIIYIMLETMLCRELECCCFIYMLCIYLAGSNPGEFIYMF